MARGVVLDEEAAREIERRLRADGYAAAVSRERYAGEDDDEDHPWAIDTDAPEVALDLMLEAHDGWLDDDKVDGAGGTAGRPLELPDAPRRRHQQ